MNELRECPFCENKDIKLFYWEDALVWKLECGKCYVTYTHVDKEKIIKFWNNRPREADLQTKLDIKQREYDGLQYKLETANNQLEYWNKEYNNIEKKYDVLRDKMVVLENDIRIRTISYGDMKNKYSNLESKIDVLKKNIETIKISYNDMKKNRDILQDEIKILKKDIQAITASYINIQNKNNTLQESLDEFNGIEEERNGLLNKIIILKEDIQTITDSYKNMEKERDILQVNLEATKKNVEIATASYSDIKNKYDVLKKSFDENIEILKQENNALQTKLNSEKTAHQYYIDTMQTRLDIAEEALRNIVSYNVKTDINNLEQQKIAQDTLKKIKDKNNQ